MAERLGGSITVESEPNVGSRFTVTIATGPIESVEWVRTASDLPKTTGQAVALPCSKRFSGHVLLAEDSPDNQRLISLYLRKLGVSVTVVENGKAAVERALAGDFDLIFMDMQMPVMDGIEATGWLRRAGYARPIVALTANAMIADQERCLAADCTDFLGKPIDHGAFSRVVARYLRPTDHGIELAATTDHAADDDPEFQTLVKQFLKNLPALLAEITDATETQRWDAATAATHQLKGMGGSFGFPDLTDLAGRIEDRLARNDFEEVSSLVKRLVILCQRIQQSS
jgi:CheY-like chemotaxis protein